ncbi:nitrate reductase cytochrome c-type subunit [Candidatus Venteria ishoeyi]|uniref:Periplasmic nitrate reductase, electron transfer subunit n=1 Tax=Candidatus Venteria ishoeyi TaxID=1899563 RepID=A0A1H6F3G9_9GAMM|nr:nitrate reductase cytochrome c-type subunit [Candidatus Venteria ishoeyi]MDM8545200.1 nitrate reductase cytochrome c-type subunit [Candidatus Venteria ishoeyi]SEH04697.1 Periplasmic nitrate reductase%2C electron transfer subunit precursor [Candidatus Venteria ishoeyi]
MKKMIQALMVGIVASMLSLTATAEVQSLRGAHDLNKGAEMFDKKKQEKIKGGIKRSYKLQPPMIPHGIEKEKISLKNNSCMKCHSQKNHKKEKAPAIGESHYLDRDGKKLEAPSARRYFCSQCHAPQVNAQPLVENNF